MELYPSISLEAFVVVPATRVMYERKNAFVLFLGRLTLCFLSDIRRVKISNSFVYW